MAEMLKFGRDADKPEVLRVDDPEHGDGGGEDDGSAALADFEAAIEGVGASVVAMFEQFGKDAGASATVVVEGRSYEVAVSITEL